MKITIDDWASYVYLREIKPGEVHHSVPMGDYVLDYDDNGVLLGIEYLGTPEIVNNSKESKKQINGNV